MSLSREKNILETEVVLNKNEVSYIWDFIKTNYLNNMFNIVNKYLDDNLDVNEDAIINILKSDDFLSVFMGDLDDLAIEYKEEKKDAIQILVDKYIKKYISIFLQLKDEVIRNKLNIMMDDYLQIIINEFSNEPEKKLPSDSEPVLRLSSSEKKLMLEKIHHDHADHLLSMIIVKNRQAEKSIMFEDLCDMSPALMADYQSLIIFDQITELRKKKELAQGLIQQYTHEILSGLKLREKEHVVILMKKAKSTFGLNQFNELFQQMKASKTYPTMLEFPEGIDEELRRDICAIDIYIHLSAFSSNLPIVRNMVNLIESEMKNLFKLPENNLPKKEENDRKKHASTNSSDAYQTKNRGSSTSASNLNDPFSIFSSLFTPVNKIKEYGKYLRKYKKDIITLNQSSSCNLFYHIAQGNHADNIKTILFNTPTATSLKDQYGNSALHLAVLCGNESVVELLIANGFDCDLGNADDNNTPLHLAMAGENEQVVRLLVEAGANVHASNKFGYDPLVLSMSITGKDSTIPVILLKSSNFNPLKTY